MTDLDALRSALHGTPGQESGTVDVAAVMTTGRRIRTRRRLARGGGVVGGTAALLVAVFALGQTGVGTGPPLALEITAARPADPNSIPAGSVVPTGYDDEVLYFVAGYRDPVVDLSTGATDAPGDTGGTGYGLTLGSTGLGRLIPLQTTGAAGRWTGFHSITNRPSGAIRLYGYYEGPVKRIVLQLEDKPVATAHTAPWSADGNVVIFWFATQHLPVDEDLGALRLVAYDENGQVLPY